MLRFAFVDMSASVVEAHMTSANRASKVLADRLGFEEVSNDDGQRVMAMTDERWRMLHRAG